MKIDVDEDISTSILLHDIGKKPQSILIKNGKLTPKKMNIIRQHPNDG